MCIFGISIINGERVEVQQLVLVGALCYFHGLHIQNLEEHMFARQHWNPVSNVYCPVHREGARKVSLPQFHSNPVDLQQDYQSLFPCWTT